MRRSPGKTEHDVTISRSCDQSKITKKYEDNYVLSSLKVYSTALVFEEQFAQTAFAVVSRAVLGPSKFYSLVASI